MVDRYVPAQLIKDCRVFTHMVNPLYQMALKGKNTIAISCTE